MRLANWYTIVVVLDAGQMNIDGCSILCSFLHIPPPPPGANCRATISGSLLQFHRFPVDVAAELDGHTAARFTTDTEYGNYPVASDWQKTVCEISSA